jgi:hypothetical protein
MRRLAASAVFLALRPSFGSFLPPNLRFHQVHANAAGIDIGSQSHYVAVPPAKDKEPVRESGSWTADLERMAVWLTSCGIETHALVTSGGKSGRHGAERIRDRSVEVT